MSNGQVNLYHHLLNKNMKLHKMGLTLYWYFRHYGNHGIGRCYGKKGKAFGGKKNKRHPIR